MKLKAYNYQIEVLTPVAILSGEKIRRFEVIKEGNKAYVLNFERLIRDEKGFVDLLVANPKILSNPDELLNMFKRFNINYRKYIKHEVRGYMRRSFEINEFIKSNGKPYIPGSSLKGALRTNIIRGTKFGSYYIKGLEFAKAHRGKIKSTTVDSKFLGDSYQSPFKFLRVSDTNLLKENVLQVKPIEIYDLLKKKKVLDTIYSEFLPVGTKLYGEINLSFYDYIKQFYFKDEYKNLEILDDFIKKVRKGVEKYIKDEISIMQEIGEVGLASFYRKLLNLNLKENQILIQLGFSTGFYSKTLVGKLSRENVIYLKKMVGKRGNKYDPRLFPKTRRVINENGVRKPLGWILMTIEEK